MNYQKIGDTIRRLRLEKQLTQCALAENLGLSCKTISKWERGLGCPDVSILQSLSTALDVDLSALLQGELCQNPVDFGNLRRLQFYRCPLCGSIATSLGGATLSCCGRVLSPLVPRPADADHALDVSPMDGELLVRFSHPMEKSHSLQFIAAVGYDRFVLTRLYPEQGSELRMPRLPGGVFYVCCGAHGLFRVPRR